MSKKQQYEMLLSFWAYLMSNRFSVTSDNTSTECTIQEMDVLIRDFMQELENMKDNERRYKGV